MTAFCLKYNSSQLLFYVSPAMTETLFLFLPITLPLCTETAVDLYSFITGDNQAAELLFIKLSALHKLIPKRGEVLAIVQALCL
jgi:hypothetical protein